MDELGVIRRLTGGTGWADMPIHPAFADHLHLLEGLPPFTEGAADPEVFRRFMEYQRATGAGAPPAVGTRTETAPRTARPGTRSRLWCCWSGRRPAGLLWLHGGAFMVGDLDMPEADWVAREICTAPVRSSSASTTGSRSAA